MNIAQGLAINPRATYRAFMKGTRNTNLYRTEFTDELLAQRVGEYRRRLCLHEPFAPPS
jgi:hypothetical protein